MRWLLKVVCIQYGPNCQTWGAWLYCVFCTFHFNNLKGKNLQAVASSRFLMRTEYYSVLWRTAFKDTERNGLPVHKQSVNTRIFQSSFTLPICNLFLMHVTMTDSIYTQWFFCHPSSPTSAIKNMNSTPSFFFWIFEPRKPGEFWFFFSLHENTHT